MATRARKVFEEVGDAGRPVAVTGVIDAGRDRGRGVARAWMLVLLALVVVMILVGGLTRLTESGLSITEWNLVMGSIPPMNAEAWAREFELYRQSPQYELMNRGMSFAEFRVIYWWEWGHRFLGRVVGLAWLLGFVGLLVGRRMPRGWTGRFALVGGLIALQGAIGWWMVASGLEEGMVSVASYRLATHLGLAFVILGLIWGYALLLGRPEAELIGARRQGEPGLRRLGTAMMHLGFLQVVLGALVAGIDAGRAFPTWPLMGDGFLPPDPFGLAPLWRNFFEDAGLVQFMHRMTGYALAALVVWAWWRSRGSPHAATRAAFLAVLGATALQVALGVWAVLSQAQIHVAIAHQAGAILLWLLIVRARFLARHPIVRSVRAA